VTKFYKNCVLLNCHRFREIPGLIHIAALAYGHIVGKQLQGNDRQRGQHKIGNFRNTELVVRFLAQGLFPVPGGDTQHHRASGLDLLDIAHHFFKQAVIGADGDHQGAILDEGNGAMLQFTAGVGLGMDIGDLL